MLPPYGSNVNALPKWCQEAGRGDRREKARTVGPLHYLGQGGGDDGGGGCCDVDEARV